MRALRTIQLAMKSLMLHKLRSGLTMLGIVFGVFSVIAMMTIGEGASDQAQKQVLELGATNIIVRSTKPPKETASNQAGGAFVLRFGLKRADYSLLMRTLGEYIVQGTPIRELNKSVRHESREMNARIVGCTPTYMDVNHLKLSLGRFISDEDRRMKGNVAVLAAETAQLLYQYENPIGKTIKITDRYYRVVGVMQPRGATAAIGGSMSGQEYNKDVYIPLETMRVRMGDLDVDRTQGAFRAEEFELNQITLQVDGQENVISTAEAIEESLKLTHGGKKDYDVIVPLELLKQAEQFRAIFNIVLGSIAAISLVVGGIGIMNIMLATVTERTREIGVRRALGAKQKDIITQFLTETMVLAGTGGLIGVGLGVATPWIFELARLILTEAILDSGSGGSEMGKMFTDMHPPVAWWSLLPAFGISVGIGILSGLYPALIAARLDPIEALRHE